MNFVLICCVQNVESCERMLGLKVGVSKRQMADRLPVGEPRFVHFGEPGTTLQPGAWAGPTQVMVVEHRSDETSLIIRPFLDADENDRLTPTEFATSAPKRSPQKAKPKCAC